MPKLLEGRNRHDGAITATRLSARRQEYPTRKARRFRRTGTYFQVARPY